MCRDEQYHHDHGCQTHTPPSPVQALDGVILTDKLWDFTVPLEPEKFIVRFNSSGNANCMRDRTIKPHDLQGVREYSGTELKGRLNALILEVLPDMAIDYIQH
ncbi:hypothetical protein A0U91_16925 (plasmid) [Acetobacter persici]|uniref:Uncharacterized protein n=1 Tax=Acetobacter persici TaxID=1076596 RepID=A0A1U9LJP8_9PROT|nr:hypothetical protein A0U91_16925 [Acetobacter persici]